MGIFSVVTTINLGANALWEGVTENAIQFTPSGSVELTKIEVTYSTQAPTTYAPTFSLETGSDYYKKYTGEQTLTLSAPPNTTIYYTTDNTFPTRHSTLYTEPIQLNQEGAYYIRAIVYNEKGEAGQVVYKGYFIDLPGVNEPIASFEEVDFYTKFTVETEYQDSTFHVWKYNSKWGGIVASGNINGKNYATKSALISPVIDLAHQYDLFLSFSEASLEFRNSEKSFFSEHTQIKIREEGGEWEALPFPYREEDNYLRTERIDHTNPIFEAYKGKKIQIGFFYTSTKEVAGTWGIKSLGMRASDSRITALEAIKAPESEVQATGGIYDLSGRRVTKAKRGFYILDGKKRWVK